MVTYISQKNAKDYRILFDKAAAALKANPPEGLDIDDSFAIGSLNEYFAYLEDLVKISADEDISRFFVRLPLDEDFFEIDANSRTIKVPNTSFGRYGVGVQGDELAEVVYFTIDRYFDSTDLASDDISIAIQWEAKDANKQVVAGISKNFGKDIETIPGKIIFGWPISSELTEVPGTIKFAVRFYSLGEEDAETHARKLNYSLSTLPADVIVNATLDYDLINKAVKEIDHGKTITGRIKNVGIYDPSLPIPQKPQVTIPLYVMSPAGNELVKIVDLPAEEDSVVKLAVSGRPTDIGVVGYDWKQFPYDSSTGTYETDSTRITSSEIEFLPVDPSETLSDAHDYYTVTLGADGKVLDAQLVSSDRIADIESDGDTFTENGSDIELYEKLSVVQVKAVGEYAVDITARAKVNTSVLEMDKADRIKIPGPLKPVINLPEASDHISVTENDKTVHAIINESTVTLEVNAQPGEQGKPATEVGDNPDVKLSYQWKKQSGEELLDVIADENHLIDEATHSLTINNLDAETVDNRYLVEVTSTRNKISTTAASGEYRVTTAPEKPILSYGGQPVDTVIHAISKQDIRGNYRTLTFNLTEPTLSDSITYLWMHATVDDEADYDEVTGQIKAQVDVDGAFDGLLGSTAFPGTKDTILDPDVAEYNEIGAIVFKGGTGSRSYQLNAADEGVYYCIVINELNNNKAASVGPFFSVS